jgi:hypothetical protein
MSEIKNIFYECIDCKFCCKTKKEMKNHIKEIQCEDKICKFEKKNKKKISENIISFIKKNNQKYLLYKDENNGSFLNNLFFLEMLNKEIPELNLNVKKEAYESVDNFFNKDYVDHRTFCFLKDALIVAYCMYLFDKKFNPYEIPCFIKYTILRNIKNRYDFFMKCDINDLKDFNNYKFDVLEEKMLEEFKKDIFKNNENQ